MTRRRLAAFAAALSLLVAFAAASPALGGPKLLSVKSAKKTFFTKKQADKRYLKRTSAAKTYARIGASYTKAETYSKAEADARFLRGGEIRAPVLPGAWSHTNGQAVVFAHPGMTMIRRTMVEPGTNLDFFGAASAPSVLNGRALKVVAIELCYELSVSQFQVVLDTVSLMRIKGSAADPVGGTETLYSTSPNTLNNGCPRYNLPAPVQLAPGDVAGIGLRLDLPAETHALVGKTSLVLTP